ncbi:hypothetical protein HYS31_02890 [Candidatus Woesearchaeota archaeon]|nr:hypothetical protein [Candidatus Woesearchaeota archaeon]
MKVLKISIVFMHIALGLYLIFVLNSPLTIYYKVSSPETFWPDYSVSRIIAETAIGIIIGLLSIVGAIGFLKDKKWAMYALPLTILALSTLIVYAALTAPPPGENWGIEGIALFFAFILFIIFVLEAVYMYFFRKRMQPN